MSEGDVYKLLWKCRDLEISQLWQRAVFLSAFLMATYIGYGTLVIEVITAEELRLSFVEINFIALLLTVIGFVFSCLWVMMAKGSKAWYEHYESAITAFENRRIHNKDYRVMASNKIKGFIIPATSNWLWNTKGGAFSVAKINIAIGHISCIIFGSLLCFHIIVLRKGINQFYQLHEMVQNLLNNESAITSLIFFVLLLFWIYVKLQVKSSFLIEKNKGR